MMAMASGAWYTSGKFTVPDNVGSNYTINIGKSLSSYLFVVEMTDTAKTQLINSGINAIRLYSFVGIYPYRSIGNMTSEGNMIVTRINPSTAAVSSSANGSCVCSNNAIDMPIKSIINTTNGVYPGYEYTYYIVEIK